VLDGVDTGVRRCVTMRLGVVLRVVMLCREGIDVRRLVCTREGTELLMRGLTCRRVTFERVETVLRLLRVGIDRVGIDRVGAERVTDRLGAGADRVVCRLLCRLVWLLVRLLLLRPLRREFCASTAAPRARTTATATARAACPPNSFFLPERNITNLLSPAISFSGNPGLPFPHHRRY